MTRLGIACAMIAVCMMLMPRSVGAQTIKAQLGVQTDAVSDTAAISKSSSRSFLYFNPEVSKAPQITVAPSKDHRWEGLGIGAAIGGAGVAFLGIGLCGGGEGCIGPILLGAVGGAVVGGVIGGLIGAAIPKDTK